MARATGHRRTLDHPDPARPVQHGPLRVQDFERSLEALSPNTLSARLNSLTDRGIIDRRFYEEHPPRAEYFLIEKGRTLGPILKALYEWGQEHFLRPAGPSAWGPPLSAAPCGSA